MDRVSSIKVCFGVLILMSLIITSASAKAEIDIQMAAQKLNYVVGETIIIGGGIYNNGPDAAQEISVSVGAPDTVELKNVSVNGVSTNCTDKHVCSSHYSGEAKPGYSIPVKIQATAVKSGKNIDILAKATSWKATGSMYSYDSGAYITSIEDSVPFPVFPSIALPIAVVLMLVFIMCILK